ncbi:MAG: hypothetical protein RJA44_2026 [Pseudomonadota bacterium]
MPNRPRPGQLLRRRALLATSLLPGLAAARLSSRSHRAVTAGEIRIAHIHSQSGPLEAYGKQSALGFMMGLYYATGGTMTVAGRKLVVIEKDDQSRPEVGSSLLATAYGQEQADLAVGPTGSGVALAMLPVAEAYRKVLLVEPAVADSITGEKWNRYIFRTGRSSAQEVIGNALALDRDGVSIATLAQEHAYGRDGVQAFKAALRHAQVVHEEFLPSGTADFSLAAQHLIEALKGRPGRRIVWIVWAGAGNPFRIAEAGLQRHGIEIATSGSILPAMAAYKDFPGLEGATSYYYGIPKNPVNDWLVTNHYRQFQSPPDVYTAGGMSAAIAVVEALKKTEGDTASARLIKAMEGLSFQTPKGRMTFRAEDHQAMQSMYHFRIKADPALPWGVPELVREIRPEEMDVPIRNRR